MRDEAVARGRPNKLNRDPEVVGQLDDRAPALALRLQRGQPRERVPRLHVRDINRVDVLANEGFDIGRSEQPPAVRAAPRPASCGEQLGLDPPANDSPVVEPEESFEIAQAQAVHPARSSPAFQTGDDRDGRPF